MTSSTSSTTVNGVDVESYIQAADSFDLQSINFKKLNPSNSTSIPRILISDSEEEKKHEHDQSVPNIGQVSWKTIILLAITVVILVLLMMIALISW